MPGTFATELATEGARWWAWAEVSGWGRRNGATAGDYRRAYRLSTLHPVDHGHAAADCDAYFDMVDDPADVVESKINIREAKVDLDGFGFTVLDGPIRNVAGGAAHGWGTDLITDLLAVHGPANVFALQGFVGVGTLVFDLDTVAGISVGDALWIGEEAVVVTVVNPGLVQIGVLRGQYNTQAAEHWAKVEGGEGILYNRPQYVVGREVRLYVNLFDSRSGKLDTALSATGGGADVGQAVLVWRGAIQDWSMPDANSFHFTCKSAMGRLDRTIGREQIRGTVKIPEDNLPLMAQNAEMPFEVERPQLGNVLPFDADYPDVAGKQYFHARLGDQIVEIRYATGAQTFTATAYGLCGTQQPEDVNANQGAQFWDVLLSHPSPGGRNESHTRYFLDAAGVPFTHPALIALALITSTGTGTNGNWDCLPVKWSAGIPYTLVNSQKFLDYAEATAGLSWPALVLGWEGKPFKLRDFIENELLGPLGLFLYPDEDGLISIGCLREYYPSDSWPTLTETDVVEDSSGPGISAEGQLGQTVCQQTWSWDYDLASGKPRQILVYRHPQVLDRMSDAAEVDRKLTGLATTADSAYVVKSMAMSFGRWWIAPRPLITASVNMDRMLDIGIADGVLLTNTVLPNPDTGSRGFSAYPCAIVGRRLCLSENKIVLTLMLVGDFNVKLWGPSGLVQAWNAGALTLTISANEYSKADGATGVPIRDALAWHDGDLLMLIDRRGVPLCDNTPAVAAGGVEGGGVNTLVLTSGFTLGGGPVVPAVTNVVVYCHYQAGAAPASAWTATMKNYAVQGDDVSGTLPNGDDAVLYGGV